MKTILHSSPNNRYRLIFSTNSAEFSSENDVIDSINIRKPLIRLFFDLAKCQFFRCELFEKFLRKKKFVSLIY